jgi:hypothetical protein
MISFRTCFSFLNRKFISVPISPKVSISTKVPNIADFLATKTFGDIGLTPLILNIFENKINYIMIKLADYNDMKIKEKIAF